MAEVAKCPNCWTSIDETYTGSVCITCKKLLPIDITNRLTEIATATTVAAAPVKQPAIAKTQQASREPAVETSAPGGKVATYEYRVIPFVGRITSGFFSTESAATVSEQLQRIINDHAAQGWEFVSVEKIDIEVKPGCLGSLFGQRASAISFDQVVFRARAR